MNMDGILIALVASTVSMALMAAYKALLEKQVKAREHVESVVGRAAGAGVSTSGASLLTGASIGSEAVLKRRKSKATRKPRWIDWKRTLNAPTCLSAAANF